MRRKGVRYAWLHFDPVSHPTNCVPHGQEDAPATVSCPAGSGGIDRIIFAEFGTASGDCDSGFRSGQCSVNLAGNMTKACAGKDSCTVSCVMGSCGIDGVKLDIGGDPCPGTPKKLSLDVACAGPPASPSVVPWHITAIRIVAQSKPANYTGSFNSSDPVLTQSWYSGAYGSRLNMMP